MDQRQKSHDGAGAGFGRIYNNLREMSPSPVLRWYEQMWLTKLSCASNAGRIGVVGGRHRMGSGHGSTVSCVRNAHGSGFGEEHILFS